MVETTIQVPDDLAMRVNAASNRIPEVLERGLEASTAIPNEVYRYILEFLTQQPSAEELANFGPTPEMEKRVSELLEKNRQDALTPEEIIELDEYGKINHFITMMKAKSLSYMHVNGN